MVLVERNTENGRNGRRSRGPSPNGQPGGTPETSSDDDSTKKIGNKSTKTKSEYEEKIRVGRDFQVQCPDLVPVSERKPDTLTDRALLVWSPTVDIPESKLEDYINVAKQRYGYNGEQALGMLFWHKHDLERAVQDLSNFTPFPDEWSVEDKVLFEQAFQFHGKSFHRIRQMLPDKTIASLVKYYYSWKKTRSRTSVIDRQQEKQKLKESSENGSENGSNEESDNEEKKWSLHRGIRRASGGSPTTIVALVGGDDHSTTTSANNFVSPSQVPATGTASSVASASVKLDPSASATVPTKPQSDSNHKPSSSTNSCFGCGVTCSVTNISPHGALCSSCFHHWRRTGSLRPTSGPCSGKRNRSVGVERYKRKPPRGMYINHDDIVALAGNVDQTVYNQNDPLNTMDREIVSLLTTIQRNKQCLSYLARQGSENLDSLRPNDASTRINPRWNAEEHQLAVQGIRKYGKDFTAIAEMIGTKTEAHLRTFFVNYRRKLNLDNLLKEFDEKQLLASKNEVKDVESNGLPVKVDDLMEVDCESYRIVDDDIEDAAALNRKSRTANRQNEADMAN